MYIKYPVIFLVEACKGPTYMYTVELNYTVQSWHWCGWLPTELYTNIMALCMVTSEPAASHRPLHVYEVHSRAPPPSARRLPAGGERPLVPRPRSESNSGRAAGGAGRAILWILAYCFRQPGPTGCLYVETPHPNTPHGGSLTSHKTHNSRHRRTENTI